MFPLVDVVLVSFRLFARAEMSFGIVFEFFFFFPFFFFFLLPHLYIFCLGGGVGGFRLGCQQGLAARRQETHHARPDAQLLITIGWCARAELSGSGASPVSAAAICASYFQYYCMCERVQILIYIKYETLVPCASMPSDTNLHANACARQASCPKLYFI